MAARESVLPAENQKRLLQTVFFMPNSDLSLLKGIIEKLPNRWNDYAEFLAWAVLANKTEVAAFLLDDGATLDSPPLELSTETYGVPPETAEALRSYRRTPYLILAACRASEEMVELLLNRGASIRQLGYIGTSKAKLNAVVSNVLGAAVFHNRPNMVRWLFSKFSGEELGLELLTQEEKGVGKSLSKEYTGCTPFLLSVHRCDTPEVASELLGQGASASALDWQQNNALHLAAALHKTALVSYFSGLAAVTWTLRNAKGETAFSIAKDKGFADVLEVLQAQGGDTSAKEAEELFQMLGKEEAKGKREKKPKAPKKKHVEEPKPVVIPPVPQVQEAPPSLPIPIEEPQAPPQTLPQAPESPALLTLQQTLAGKTQLSTLSPEELHSLQSELQEALAAVQIALSRK
jgi:ankyrin repeat protein